MGADVIAGLIDPLAEGIGSNPACLMHMSGSRNAKALGCRCQPLIQHALPLKCAAGLTAAIA